MSLLKPGTPINRDTVDEAVEKIALSCALGVRQHETILKLIEDGYLKIVVERIPGRTGLVGSFVGGKGGLPWKSWTGMKKRLLKAGFQVVTDKERQTLQLQWGVSE